MAMPLMNKWAARIIASMDEMFSIDAAARSANLHLAARHKLRLERSRPLLEALKPEIEAVQREALPASALGKAARYTLALWSKLLRFLEYPEIELSNNLAENSMRPLVLGRKNWIHLGSQEAGPKVAAILSVVESCRRLKIPIRDYLADVFQVWLIAPCAKSKTSHPLPGLLNKLFLRQVRGCSDGYR